MTIEELKKLLDAGEWNDIEFKEARNAVPKSAYESVCSFSNSHGGWLIFGISQTGEHFEITGVGSPDKLQNDFLSVLHAGGKINHDIQVSEDRLVFDCKTVLVFHISENARTRKPVYLDGDIRRTFLRKGGGDYKAQMQDIERMLRDATGERWDGQELKPIRAAIILFGSPRAVHQLMPRPTLDVQFLPYGVRDEMPETRWIDRFVSEDNIIQSWQQLVAKYKFFMPKPFREIDPHTLSRQDTPPGFRVFREAAVNLLIHQDYGDHSRKATIKFFQDGIQFWNPGDVFGDDSRLLEPGEKEVRNPSITAAMRRIVLCEQAGTGLRMMQREWQKLGHPAPIIRNNRVWKAFEFFIPGLDSEYDAASTLMKAMFKNKTTLAQAGIEQVESPKAQVEAQEAQVEAQEAQETQGGVQEGKLFLNPVETAILKACREQPRTASELLTLAGYSSRTGYFKRCLNRLLTSKLIYMTIPGRPRSSKQKYRLTETGLYLLNHQHENAKP